MGRPIEPGERPPDAPATVEDLSSLKRWLWVVGAWAAAASIIAIVALVTGGDDSDTSSASTRSDIAELEQSLDGRLDNLEQEVDEAATAQDLQRLTNRVEELEQQVEEAADGGSQADQDLDDIRQQLDQLDQRVEELEAGPPASQESP